MRYFPGQSINPMHPRKAIARILFVNVVLGAGYMYMHLR